MGIKHFLVKVKGIKYKEKGLKNFIKYLQDKKRHPNGIINFSQFKGEKFFINVANTIDKNEKMKSFRGKGGRPITSYADGFIFSFPPSLKDKLDKNKISSVTIILIQKLFELFNQLLEKEKKDPIDYDTFLKYIFVNVHTDKHVHINFVISRVLEVGNNEFLSNRITNRKKFLNTSKYIFDEIIEKEFQLKKELYKTETNIHKGYKNKYFKEVIETVKKEKEQLNSIKNNIDKELNEFLNLKNLLDKKRSEIQNETKKLLEQNEKREKIATAFQLIIRYYKNWRKELTNKNTIKVITEFNKLKKKINEFSQINDNEKLDKIVNEIKEDMIKNNKGLKLK